MKSECAICCIGNATLDPEQDAQYICACSCHVEPKPRRVLFLDIDGVLNSDSFYAKLEKSGIKFDNTTLDPAAIERLNQIIEKTKCEIVVSSTWREVNLIPEIESRLKEYGFKYTLLDATPVLHVPRGLEIREWLSHNPEVKNYVALDDNPVNEISRLVSTTYRDGLQDVHVALVIEMFEFFS